MTSQTSRSRSKRPQIRCTDHALIRARQRYSELRHLTDRQLATKVKMEVGEAIREYRRAKSAPRVACVDTDERAKLRGNVRYVWTADRHRVYVIGPGEVNEQPGFIVITTLSTVTARP